MAESGQPHAETKTSPTKTTLKDTKKLQAQTIHEMTVTRENNPISTTSATTNSKQLPSPVYNKYTHITTANANAASSGNNCISFRNNLYHSRVQTLTSIARRDALSSLH